MQLVTPKLVADVHGREIRILRSCGRPGEHHLRPMSRDGGWARLLTRRAQKIGGDLHSSRRRCCSSSIERFSRRHYECEITVSIWADGQIHARAYSVCRNKQGKKSEWGSERCDTKLSGLIAEKRGEARIRTKSIYREGRYATLVDRVLLLVELKSGPCESAAPGT